VHSACWTVSHEPLFLLLAVRRRKPNRYFFRTGRRNRLRERSASPAPGTPGIPVRLLRCGVLVSATHHLATNPSEQRQQLCREIFVAVPVTPRSSSPFRQRRTPLFPR